ncbi:MAG: serine hydrolase domain-containing protein, partial [Myxococcota bacterium]
ARTGERLRGALVELIETKGLPGASAALVLADGTELAVAVGFADVEAEREMAPEDRLLSGSIGKTYVTAAAHHLEHAGKLSFDDRAADHLGDEDGFARLPNAADVTIRQLLRHRTGIPRYVFEGEFWSAVLSDPDRVWKPAELLAYVSDREPLFPAGEGWAYADTNYIVVGMILEKVSGVAFHDYVRANLLAPHGLEDTVPSDSRRIPGLAQGYVGMFRDLGLPERALEDDTFVVNPQFEWCGGGYANTPSDLARWARILFSGEAFDAPYLETMLDTVAAPGLGPGKEYGLGVIVSHTELGELRGHDGIMVGFLSTMGYLPEHDVAAALQLNTDDMRAVGRPLVDVMLDLARIAVEEAETAAEVPR